MVWGLLQLAAVLETVFAEETRLSSAYTNKDTFSWLWRWMAFFLLFERINATQNTWFTAFSTSANLFPRQISEAYKAVNTWVGYNSISSSNINGILATQEQGVGDLVSSYELDLGGADQLLSVAVTENVTYGAGYTNANSVLNEGWLVKQNASNNFSSWVITYESLDVYLRYVSHFLNKTTNHNILAISGGFSSAKEFRISFDMESEKIIEACQISGSHCLGITASQVVEDDFYYVGVEYCNGYGYTRAWSMRENYWARVFSDAAGQDIDITTQTINNNLVYIAGSIGNHGFISALNATSGATVFEKSFANSASANLINAITIKSDGSILAVGMTRSYGPTAANNIGNAWVLWFSSALEIKKVFAFGGSSGNTVFQSVILQPNNQIEIVGYSQSLNSRNAAIAFMLNETLDFSSVALPTEITYQDVTSAVNATCKNASLENSPLSISITPIIFSLIENTKNLTVAQNFMTQLWPPAPTSQPSVSPTKQPSSQPTVQPTLNPSPNPTPLPTRSVSEVRDMDLSLLNSAQGVTITGISNSYFGYSVSTVGDVNGDSYPDVAVGAPRENNGVGAAYIIYGGQNKDIDINQLNKTMGFKIFGDNTLVYGDGSNGYGGFGWSVGSAGDFNGDDVDDLVIGAPGANGSAGRAYIILGNNTNEDIHLTNLSFARGFYVTRGNAATQSCGFSVSSAGDVNGDGLSDVIIGELYGGISHIILGKKTGFQPIDLNSLASSDGVDLYNACSDINNFCYNSYSVSQAGDFNRDGYADIVLGAPRWGYLPTGYVRVIYGNKTFNQQDLAASSLLQNFFISGEPYDEVGDSVSNAGDFNGDGYSDILLGAPALRHASSSIYSAYIIYGNQTNINLNCSEWDATRGARIARASDDNLSGLSVSGIGDINGDGLDDVLVAATSSSGYQGKAYVIFGTKNSADIFLNNLTASQGFMIYGPIAGGSNGYLRGYSVSRAGDFNQDGYADYVLGAFDLDKVYILFGNSYQTDFPTSQPTSFPSVMPSTKPSIQPTSQPTALPVAVPSTEPSSDPSADPSEQPIANPSAQPTGQPTLFPSAQPSRMPTKRPTNRPSRQPYATPSSQPSNNPTSKPTRRPTKRPSSQPSNQPSNRPTTYPTVKPSNWPTNVPWSRPSSRPSRQPTRQPSRTPSVQPSRSPSVLPSVQPSSQPTCKPTKRPSLQPSCQPTNTPSVRPTTRPTWKPISWPSSFSSSYPTFIPITLPSGKPTLMPVALPTHIPIAFPTSSPSVAPTLYPSMRPSVFPTSQPTGQPTRVPVLMLTLVPTLDPTTGRPTLMPTLVPTWIPTSSPSKVPSIRPAYALTLVPTLIPTIAPSVSPTLLPSGFPTPAPISDLDYWDQALYGKEVFTRFENINDKMIAFSINAYWEFYFDGHVAYSQNLSCSVTSFVIINTSTIIYTCMQNNLFSLFSLNRFLHRFSSFSDVTLPQINQLIFEPLLNTLYVVGENDDEQLTILKTDMDDVIFSGKTFVLPGYHLTIRTGVSIGNVTGLTGIIVAGDATSSTQQKMLVLSFDADLAVRAARILSMLSALQNSIYTIKMLPCEPGFFGCGNIIIGGVLAGRAFVNYIYSPYLLATGRGFRAYGSSVFTSLISIGDDYFAVGTLNGDIITLSTNAANQDNVNGFFGISTKLSENKSATHCILSIFNTTLTTLFLTECETNANESVWLIVNETLGVLRSSQGYTVSQAAFAYDVALISQSFSLTVIMWMQTLTPTLLPTRSPTLLLTKIPTIIPTVKPSKEPLVAPSRMPFLIGAPTELPVVVTELPSETPSETPSEVPSEALTELPTSLPTSQETSFMTFISTFIQTYMTNMPTMMPTRAPALSPTSAPQKTRQPFSIPTTRPTVNVTKAAPVMCNNVTAVACHVANSDHKKDNIPEWAQWTIGTASLVAFIVACIFYTEESRAYLFSCFHSKDGKKQDMDQHFLGIYTVLDQIIWEFEDDLSHMEESDSDVEEEKDSEGFSEIVDELSLSEAGRQNRDEDLPEEKSSDARGFAELNFFRVGSKGSVSDLGNQDGNSSFLGSSSASSLSSNYYP